jgi:hypothetical protein
MKEFLVSFIGSSQPMDEWVKKMWHIYIMEYYSVIKKNEIKHLQEMELEIMLTEISQTQKDKYHVFSQM